MNLWVNNPSLRGRLPAGIRTTKPLFPVIRRSPNDGSVSSSVSVVNQFQTKVIGARKRLICARNWKILQLVRRKGGFAHGFHSRPVKVSGFFAVAPPEQVRCWAFPRTDSRVQQDTPVETLLKRISLVSYLCLWYIVREHHLCQFCNSVIFNVIAFARRCWLKRNFTHCKISLQCI